MEITNRVLETLKNSDKPLKNSEIATISGIDQKDVEKAIKKLKTEDKVESPIRCFWSAK